MPARTPVLTLIVLLLLLSGAPVFAQAAAPGVAKSGALKSQRNTAAAEWRDLSAAQQTALGPLAPIWGNIGEAPQRKWLALSHNYAALSPAEQATLHGRMREWATLSTAQRNQARINFAQTKSLSTEEKKARWEAYQALSLDQKNRLAARAKTRAVGASTNVVTPGATDKLAKVPITRSRAGGPNTPARPRTKPPRADSGDTPSARP